MTKSVESELRDDLQHYKEKAGIMLVGERGGELCVIAPWLEGAFDDEGTKAYLLPRGSVDENELEQAVADDGYMGEALCRYIIEDMMQLDYEKIHDARIDLQEIQGLPEKQRERELEKFDSSDLDRVNRFFGAIRETYEETGINILRIEGFLPEGVTPHPEGNIEGLSLDHPIDRNMPIDLQLKESQATVPSSRRNPHRQTMYLVKVKGIEKLEGQMKGSRDDIAASEIRVPKSARAKTIAKKKGLPSFAELLQVLRYGMIPVHIEDLSRYNQEADWERTDAGGYRRKKTHWTLNSDIKRTIILPDPSFNQVERGWLIEHGLQEIRKEVAEIQSQVERGFDSAFEATAGREELDEKAKSKIEHIGNVEVLIGGLMSKLQTLISGGRFGNGQRMEEHEFDAFYDELLRKDKESSNPGYVNAIKDDTSRIKAELKKRPEIADLLGDADGLKLNVKNRPLRWTREGADILPFDQYLDRIAHFAEINQPYRHMMTDYETNDRQTGQQELGRSSLHVLKALYEKAESLSELQGTPDTEIFGNGAERLWMLRDAERAAWAEHAQSGSRVA